MRKTPPSAGADAGSGPSNKRQRVPSYAHRGPPSTDAIIVDPSFPPKTPSSPPPCSASSSRAFPASSSSLTRNGFNDASTADVVLRLIPDSTSSPDEEANVVYLHSSSILHAKYFSTALSDRWSRHQSSTRSTTLNLTVNSDVSSYLTVLELLYTLDFINVVTGTATALSILPVALELLFEECVKYCVKFLEAVPWTVEEEKAVLALIPLLGEEECNELLPRVTPIENEDVEQMLNGLIHSTMNNCSNVAYVKAFVARLLRDFDSKGGVSMRRVLEGAFEVSFRGVRESLEDYSSPDFRENHNETEAIQRLNLHTANTNGKHLLWLVERMIELRVADGSVKAWSEQGGFTTDLQKAIKEDALRHIVPGFPTVVLRCTCKLANAVASGTILAARQVRMKLVKNWLPVLIVCKDNMSSMMPHKSLYVELEETFLKIISTLPMSDAQELLKECLNFSTRNVDDCPHLITAFKTWFRRATRAPVSENH